MTYATGREYYDADSHIMELPNFLTEFADPGIRKQLPAISYAASAVSEEEALELMHQNGHSQRYKEELFALGDDMIRGPKEIQALGAFDGADRGIALDMLGFQKQLVFSTLSAALPLSTRVKTEGQLQYGAARAHNRAMQAFCNHDDRLLPVVIIPLDRTDAAVEELDNCIVEGRVGAVWIPHRPCGGRSPGHPEMNAFWERLSDAGIPFVIHIGGVSYQLDPAWLNNGGDKPSDWLGGGENVRAKDMTAIHHAAELFISALVLDGVFERFPKLQGASVELGAGWVPSMLQRLDWTVEIWKKTDQSLRRLTRKPSEQLAQQFGFTPYVYEDVGELIVRSQPELYLFSSDYPHTEGGRDPIGRFRRALDGHDERAQECFYAGNFKRIFTELNQSVG